MDPELLRTVSPKDYYEAYLKEGLRPDCRKIDKTRKYAISLCKIYIVENGACLVRIGNTAVMCDISEGKGVEGWEDLSYLGETPGKARIRTLVDDGNLIEAISLAYQLSINKEEFLYPFTYADLYKFYIRDPVKDEENLSSSQLSLFISSSQVIIQKTKGSGIALSDLESLVSNCRLKIEAANENIQKLKQNRSFVGKLYSIKNNN